ncbi:hypothetical protein FHT29_000644 [Rhizobium sp. SG741]|jgi:hypothetical protein|nr:hypothetical protein [Rhizobium sp. SG741]
MAKQVRESANVGSTRAVQQHETEARATTGSSRRKAPLRSPARAARSRKLGESRNRTRTRHRLLKEAGFDGDNAISTLPGNLGGKTATTQSSDDNDEDTEEADKPTQPLSLSDQKQSPGIRSGFRGFS